MHSINELVALARTRGWPVIWIRQEHAPDLSDASIEIRTKRIPAAIRGTLGAMHPPGLDVKADEPVIIKKRYSAFFGTNFDGVLAQLGTRRLILCGINTHACVRTSAIDAYQRDFELIVARDCVGSYDHEHHALTLRYFDGKIARVLSNAEIAS